MNTQNKTCQNCEKEFKIEPEDFEFYEKIKVPSPTFCPECRLQRRMIFKNERTFYKRKCDLCRDNIISIHPQDLYRAYCPKCWWSDKWNSMDYGKDYDFSKPFFVQFQELLKKVPRISLAMDYLRTINSEYSNYTGPLKNCYLLIQAENDENCCYSSSLINSKESTDCLMATKVERSYELFNCEKCYNTFFSNNCFGCMDVYFSKDLKNCSNCFGCANLRHKNYYLFNKPYSKKDYSQFINNLNSGSFNKIKKYKETIKEFWIQFPNKYFSGSFNNNVSGNYITNSKNVFNSFEICGGENLKYCFQAHMPMSKDCYDYGDWGNNASLMYESINCGENISNTKFSVGSWIASNLHYCDTVVSSDYMFGCSMMRKSKYCILNKQYTKEEYEELVPKIIKQMNEMPYVSRKSEIRNPKFETNSNVQNSKLKEKEIVYKYGEFFPPELSPFCYNETIAQEYFPLTKEQAIEKGYSWKDPEDRNIKIDIKTEDLPDDIKDVSDDILGKVIQCAHAKLTNIDYTQTNTDSLHKSEISQYKSVRNEQCTTAFKIIPQELEFYRKMNLPLPRLCPNCRHHERIKQRNPLKLWHRKCMCGGSTSDNGIYKNTIEHFHGDQPCPNEFETTYSPDRPEIVYCEKCYQSEVA